MQTHKANPIKGHILFLFMDLFAIGSYLGFSAYSKIQQDLSNLNREIIVDESGFYTFMLLFIVAFHILLILVTHTPISKTKHKEHFLNIGIVISFLLSFFSGYFVSNHVENKLIKADYHFCENLSYSGNYKSTHYVWRAKGISCDANPLNLPVH